MGGLPSLYWYSMPWAADVPHSTGVHKRCLLLTSRGSAADCLPALEGPLALMVLAGLGSRAQCVSGSESWPPTRLAQERCTHHRPPFPCLQKQTFLEKVKDRFEPSVPTTTLVNEGSIFLILALWCVHWCTSSARSACAAPALHKGLPAALPALLV